MTTIAIGLLPDLEPTHETEHLRIFASRLMPPGATGRRVMLTAYSRDEDKPEVLTCVLLPGEKGPSPVRSNDGWIDLIQPDGHPWAEELLAAANEMFGPLARG